MSYLWKEHDISVLVGKTLSSVTNKNDRELDFVTIDGETFRMYHYQDCCESVSIEDIAGDLSDLVGSPIFQAEVVSDREIPKVAAEGDRYQDESFTWTFYKLATIKGSVTIRWYGTSNGYYSERVDFVLVGEE